MAGDYDAFWIPGPDDFDMDAALQAGGRWLARAPYTGRKVVVLHAKKMLTNRRTLQDLSAFHVVSPNARDIPYGNAGGVLAVWPGAPELELAMDLARGNGLCVIPNRYDIAWWIAQSGASNLIAPDEAAPTLAALPDEAVQILNSIVRFGGHNSFLGGGEKEDAVADLRRLHGIQPTLSGEAIEQHILASGETDAAGARRIRDWWETIRSGGGLRDYRGRSI